MEKATMIDRSSIQHELLKLSERIANSDSNAAMRLRMLAEAVDGGKFADAWAQSDIFKIIDLDTTTEQLNGSRKDIQKFRSDLAHALAGASLILSARSWRSPSNSLDLLENAAQKIDAASMQNAKLLGDMTQNIYSTFEKIAREMTEQIQKSNRYFEQLGN